MPEAGAAAEGLRFKPPPHAIGAETRWVLLRAFGPTADGREAAAPGLDLERAVDLALRLDLGARIAGRGGAESLTRELGDDRAGRLLAARRAAVATALMYEHLAARIAAVAARHSIPLIFLKGYALHATGVVAAGSRPFADLDLLVPGDHAGKLQQHLIAEGFTAPDGPANEQHLPPLQAPGWGAVDVHYRLRGIELRPGTWAGAEDLLAGGHCRALDGLPGSCFTPEPRVLAAQLLVHGVEQHGFRPRTYSLFRMLGDLQDLLADEARWDAFLTLAGPWMEAHLGRGEIAAIRRLSHLLSAGTLPSPGCVEDSGAGLMLRHILAGIFDSEYARSLESEHTRARLISARRQGRLLRHLTNKILPSRDTVEAHYGESSGLWIFWMRRLAHPIRRVRSLFGSRSRRPPDP